ncbi:MAG: mechanosensitive ion channel [Actinobacteria bacterium]|nr:mechanosensitive ion channel [Actinomycetota bacterium]MBU2687461.1 mechanosensitive ion channel [Actinomycetota bacterium]
MLVFGTSFTQPFVDLWNRMVKAGPSWIVAIGILIIAWLLAKLVRSLVRRAVSRTSTQGHVDILVSRAAGAFVFFLGILSALSEIGMSLSAALATLGLASVGVGFALQDVLSNFFAGVVLLIQHPFQIGDQVRLGDQEGVVENVRVRDTQLLTFAGERVFVPNKTVFNNPIINYSSTPSLRQELRIAIKFSADIPEARRIAREAMAATEGIQEQPPPSVMVEPEKEHVVLVLRYWTESERSHLAKVNSELSEKLMSKLQKAEVDYLHEKPPDGHPLEPEAEPAPDDTQPI